MESLAVTGYSVSLAPAGRGPVRAYLTVEVNRGLVIRGVKVLELNGGLSMHMPSRKVERPCPDCGAAAAWKSNYCHHCAAPLASYWERLTREALAAGGRAADWHQDVVHPANASARKEVETAVLNAYLEAAARAAEGVTA